MSASAANSPPANWSPTSPARRSTRSGRSRQLAHHRARNRWNDTDEVPNHPYPGTYPVVTTDEKNWGGWRVPSAEYDRDPQRIEFQARIIEAAPHLMRICQGAGPVRPQLFRRHAGRTAGPREEGHRPAAPHLRNRRAIPVRQPGGRIGRRQPRTGPALRNPARRPLSWRQTL